MNDFAFLHDPWRCVEMVTRLAGLSVTVSALEWLAARHGFADDAALGWPLLRQRSRLNGDGPVARWLGVLFGTRGFAGLQALRLLAGLTLLGLADDPVAGDEQGDAVARAGRYER